MEHLKVEEARKNFAELLNASQWQGRHTSITRHGRTAGILVPPDWYEQAVEALSEKHRDSPSA